MLSVEGLSKRYGEQVVLQDIQFEVGRGVFLSILGPNGCGKSTLIRLLAGIERPDTGQVRLEGKPVLAYRRKELARKVAVVRQEGLPPLPFSVQEVVMMGRFAYQRWLQSPTPEDERVVEQILEQTGLIHLRHKPLEQLSGGERQRAAIAQAMAQQPRLLLLDEPTTFLDIGYQIALLNLIRQWQTGCGLTVIAVLHDLNLAALYSQQLILMHQGRVRCFGSLQEVLTEPLIREVYGTSPIILPHPRKGVPQVLLA
ncbi:MAG: ABC transporter ATP-binding protein [Bacillus thermozeamaize]|uniref:ABC transporter ATP-binding protein n=1 Tax=Bacillus thermozeamaize TaxID=230954 RepID=A0A1Y3PEI7_9BACI|nr:MAG: ABC transporter ATP-binding protein [Bacillus thermozeamaize]